MQPKSDLRDEMRIQGDILRNRGELIVIKAIVISTPSIFEFQIAKMRWKSLRQSTYDE